MEGIAAAPDLGTVIMVLPSEFAGLLVHWRLHRYSGTLVPSVPEFFLACSEAKSLDRRRFEICTQQ